MLLPVVGVQEKMRWVEKNSGEALNVKVYCFFKKKKLSFNLA